MVYLIFVFVVIMRWRNGLRLSGFRPIERDICLSVCLYDMMTAAGIHTFRYLYLLLGYPNVITSSVSFD